MSDANLKYPSIKAARSVLRKVGVDDTSRIDAFDQDFEYTSCLLEELEDYIDLYDKPDTSLEEKRVLGCYFLECLNDYVSLHGKAHALQDRAFALLFNERSIHLEEIEYRLRDYDGIEEHCWPIRKELIKWQSI